MTRYLPIQRALTAAPMLLPIAMLGACGGGGGGGVNSASSNPATVTPSPSASYDTAEYRGSIGPSTHGALTAYQAGYSGQGVVVGIVDSGIDTGNAEFAGRISSQSAAFNGGSSYDDVSGHGTEVATVLAGARNDSHIMGMAWGATIMALRTDTCSVGSCDYNESAIAAAIDYARTHGTRVINISLGSLVGDPAPSLQVQNAVRNATAAGIVIVLSAGNNGQAAPNIFAATLAAPSVSNNLVLIAGSVNSAGTVSSFSDRAAGFEGTTLFAVGENITTQDQNGVWTNTNRGTSFSAPLVSGAVALMQQAFPNLTAAQIVARLLATATDAGAAGADAVYGSGILNVAAAIAPVGPTSLANSSVVISTGANGSGSAAMGDMSGGAVAQAVVIDAMGRAYRVDVGQTIATAGRAAVLGAGFGLTPRRMTMGGDRLGLGLGLGLSLRLAPQQGVHTRFGDAQLLTRDAMPTSAIVTARAGRLALGAGLREAGSTLAGLVEGREGGDAFLAASTPQRAMGFVHDPKGAMALAMPLGEGFSLTALTEQGTVRQSNTSQRAGRGDSGYTLAGARLGWASGRARLTLSASRLNEQDTMLGGRFADWLGINGSRSDFIDASSSLGLGDGWHIGAAARLGWTRAIHTLLRSSAWSIDAGKDGVITGADRLDFRLAQPLRVSRGGIAMMLPTRYDYTTGSATWERQTVGLAPRGRELDAEMAWQAPLGGSGWLGLNSYWRRQPGNVAWAGNEWGGALQLRFGY